MKINIECDLLVTHAKIFNDYIQNTNGENITSITVENSNIKFPEAIYFQLKNSNVLLNTIKFEGRKFDPHFKDRRTTKKINHTFNHQSCVVLLTNKAIHVYNSNMEFLRSISLKSIEICEITKSDLCFITTNNKQIRFITNNIKVNYRFMILTNMLVKI